MEEIAQKEDLSTDTSSQEKSEPLDKVATPKSDESKEKKVLYGVIGVLFVLLLFSLFAAVRLYSQNNELNNEVDALDVQVTQLKAQVNRQIVEDPLPLDDTSDDDTRPADGETPSEKDSDEYDVMYEYTFNGQPHTLVMDNPEGLSYKVETQEVYGQVLVVNLDDKTTLEVRLNDEGGEPGIFGDFMTVVKGDIIRNRYFGDHYLLRADGLCNFPATAENPCVITLFHNDDDGMLSAYVRFEDQDQAEDNTPSDEALALADAMIASYTVE